MSEMLAAEAVVPVEEIVELFPRSKPAWPPSTEPSTLISPSTELIELVAFESQMPTEVLKMPPEVPVIVINAASLPMPVEVMLPLPMFTPFPKS